MKKNKLLLTAMFVGVAALVFCGILFAQGMGQPYPERQQMAYPDSYRPAGNPGASPSAPQRMIMQEKNAEPGLRDQMLAKIIELRVRRHEYDKVREIAPHMQMRELAVGMILARVEGCHDAEEAGKMLDLATELLLKTRFLPVFTVPMSQQYMPEGHVPQQYPMMPQGQGQPMPMQVAPMGIAAPLGSGAIVITQSVPGPGSVMQAQPPSSAKDSSKKEKPYTAPSYSGSFYGLYPQQSK